MGRIISVTIVLLSFLMYTGCNEQGFRVGNTNKKSSTSSYTSADLTAIAFSANTEPVTESTSTPMMKTTVDTSTSSVPLPASVAGQTDETTVETASSNAETEDTAETASAPLSNSNAESELGQYCSEDSAKHLNKNNFTGTLVLNLRAGDIIPPHGLCQNGKQKKVILCHVPRGNIAAAHIIWVAPQAVATLVSKGDSIYHLLKCDGSLEPKPGTPCDPCPDAQPESGV